MTMAAFGGRFGLAGALAGKTRGESKTRVGEWRDDVNMLSHHISTQMEYCKNLRNHETLRKMMEEDPEERDRKRLNQFIDNMKADVRTLHNDIAERMLGKPVKGKAKDPRSAALAGSAVASPWHSRTLELEEVLGKFRPHVEGSGGTAMRVADLLELSDIRQGLWVELSEHLVKKKNDLDSSLGISVDIARTVDDDDPVMRASRSVRAFLRVMDAFVGMEQLIKQANMTVDGVRHGRALARLQEQRDEVLAELSDANALIKELEEAAQDLRDGVGGKAVSQQTLKLDEAVTRMRELEQRDALLSKQNGLIVARNGVLQDQVDRLRTSLSESKERHKLDTEWYQPRIATLEASMKEATSTITTVQMDVELLASMYKSGVEELEAMQVNVDSAFKERDLFARKVHEEVQKVVGLRNELRRKDDIAIQLNAARRAAVRAYEETKHLAANTEEARRSFEQRLSDMGKRVDELEADLAKHKKLLERSRAETKQMEAERDEAQATARLRTLEKEELNKELDVMTQKVVDAGLDEAGKTRYDRLQVQLHEAYKKHTVLEDRVDALSSSNTRLKDEVKRLKRVMKEEGVEDTGT